MMEILNRQCPLCNRDIFYASKDALSLATKKQSVCKSCSTKKQYVTYPLKNKGANNGRYGKSIEEIIITKYGQEIGSQKYEEWSKKLGEHGFQKGALNPSFGKSPSHNSGKSYKGWYKNMFFRSTLELAFLLKYESINGKLPLSGDDKKYRVTYIGVNGNMRTYVPDFVCLMSNSIYELKCSAFISKPENLLKAEAAKTAYDKMGLSYSIITEKDVDNFNCDTFLSRLKYLNDIKIIKLTDKSVSKLNERLNKGNKMCL